MLASTLLGGCFLAENDATDPIIPDSELAYPIAMGEGRQCEVGSEEDMECARARFEQLDGGGYSITVWNENDEGEVVPTPSGEFRLRALSGTGVPHGTYLAQRGDTSVDQRYLGLLTLRQDGGWNKVEPQCEQLTAEAFVPFVNHRWLATEEGTTLENATCIIRREGLTDERLYSILSASRSGVSTVLYSGQ